MNRSILWYWRTQLALALGCAVATTVLSGALVVGDSVRASLRHLAERRLGGVEDVLVGPRFVREELAADLARGSDAEVAPLVLVPGAVRHVDSGRRQGRTTLFGIGEGFERVFGAGADFSRAPGQIFPSAVASSTLARELDARVGDDLLVIFGSVSTVPRESLIGRRDDSDSVESLRVTVIQILEEGEGLDLFSLDTSQAPTPSLFLSLERLQDALGQADRVNTLVARGANTAILDELLVQSWTTDDLGLVVRRIDAGLSVESERLVLAPPVAAAALAAAAESGLSVQPVSTYLASAIEGAGREVPYSTVSALDPSAFGEGLFSVDGDPIPGLAPDEIVLDRWTADDLGVTPGDEITLAYDQVGPHEELIPRRETFRLASVAEMSGMAIDDSLTPPYPGMSEVDDISAWEPPFPIDFDRIRDRDEEYWDQYRAAPKAFVALERGRELWGGRFGDLTSVRVQPSADRLETVASELPGRILDLLSPNAVGLSFRPVRQQALEAARGATDFSQLFLGFGFFLIAAAALLASLLFRLGLESRSSEVGLLAAVGFPPRTIRRRFLLEGLVSGTVGVGLGTLGAVLFGAAMLAGLRTWWLPAVGTTALSLELRAPTLVLGAAISLALVAITILLTVRRLSAASPVAALAGRPSALDTETSGRGPRSRIWAVAGLGLGGGLLAASPWLPGDLVVPVTLSAGALLLVGGVASYAWWLSGQSRFTSRRALGGSPLVVLGSRNAGRHRSRSIASVALVASACFVIALVTAFRGDEGVGVEELERRAGGFTLMAQSAVPLTADLARPEGRRELGLDEESAPWGGLNVSPFRLRPGDDASCLNLYRPSVPRILGVPTTFTNGNQFVFRAAVDDRENPWTLLEEPLEDGVRPAIADFASAQWILHKGLGDEIEIPVEGSTPIRLRLVALLDGSLFQSEILISEEAFVEAFPDRPGYSVFLLDPPGDTVETTTTALEAGLDRFGFDVQRSADRLAGYDAVEHTYLATFQTLGGLGFLLGTVGLGILMLRNVLERRHELAALRAFGFRPTTLAGAVVVENGILLAVGILVGGFAGLAAAAPQLIHGYRELPWESLGLTLVGLLSVGLLSTLVAARRVVRMPVLENL